MIKNYRSQLPFGDDVLAQIRKDVMTQIEHDARASRPWFGLFLRATLAASALVVVLLWPNRPVDEPATSRPVVESSSRRVETAPPVAVVVAEKPLFNKPLVDSTPRRLVASPRPVKRAPEPVSAEPEVVRIELQTSDPDVRIIWITNDSGDTR